MWYNLTNTKCYVTVIAILNFVVNVLYACNLIHNMLSSILYGKSPFALLYPDKNMFSLLPRVFGMYIPFSEFNFSWTTYLPDLSSVYLLATLEFKRYKCYDLIPRKYFIYIGHLFCVYSYFTSTLFSQQLLPSLSLPLLVSPISVKKVSLSNKGLIKLLHRNNISTLASSEPTTSCSSISIWRSFTSTTFIFFGLWSLYFSSSLEE